MNKHSSDLYASSRKNSLAMALLGAASAAILVAVVVFTTAAERDWRAAEKINTVAAYREFIRSWPAELHVQYAKAAINRLEKQALKVAELENSVSAYQNFLTLWPQGRYAEIIENRLAEMNES